LFFIDDLGKFLSLELTEGKMNEIAMKNKKAYQCPLCPYSAKYNGILKKHLIKVHELNMGVPEKVKIKVRKRHFD
jgi:hypothetical protein